MAAANILRAIEKMNSSLIENPDVTKKYIVNMASNELRSILDFVADKKFEEGSSLKYWIDDVLELVRDSNILILDTYHTSFVYLNFICDELKLTTKCILQLGVEEANKCPIIPSSPLDECVVGLERDVQSILRKSILCESRGLRTMCIVGMAGVGKTTLARKVYNHPTIVDRYEHRFWVSASGEQSNKELLMKLALQVLHNEDHSLLVEEMENADNESLQRIIRQHLQDKQFFIVLDNMGKIPYAKSIYKAIPDEADMESKLLLTSRFRSTKYSIEDEDILNIEMKPLDDDQSWQLFLQLLLFGNQNFPKQLQGKGRDMLRSCAGLPLSIKEVATQFVIKRQSGTEWEQLLESIDLSTTLAVLESVYHKWPPKLKSCFLCLSFFEKCTSIRREKLIQVWTAGEVIPQEEEKDQDFDYAEFSLDSLEGYKTTLMKLADESIIDIDMDKKNRCIKCIRINESFHTLSMAKAGEEMVFETLKKGEGNPPSSREPRHRAIYCSRDEFNLFTDHDEFLFSLFFRGGGYLEASELYWKCFEQLRTLDFEGFGLKILPESIGTLTQLRYLGLRNNYIQVLPLSLGCLKNLEVLDIELNFMVQVPDIVWEISSLHHLYMSDIICQKPLKIDTLKNLETLTYISVSNWTYDVSSLEMISLRKLGIEEVDGNLDIRKLIASLASLTKLDCLILRGFQFSSLPSLHGLETLHRLREIKLDGHITKLPSAHIFPPYISELSLINSFLDEDPMLELSNLFYLRYLKLKNAYTGEQMMIPRSGFASLKVMCIEELWHLRNIQIEIDTIWLAKLEIISCPYLESIPRDIISYRMKELKLFTTRRVAAKIREWDFTSKIEHFDIQP